MCLAVQLIARNLAQERLNTNAIWSKQSETDQREFLKAVCVTCSKYIDAEYPLTF